MRRTENRQRLPCADLLECSGHDVVWFGTYVSEEPATYSTGAENPKIQLSFTAQSDLTSRKLLYTTLSHRARTFFSPAWRANKTPTMSAREDMYIRCILSTHAQTRSCAWWRQLKTHSNAKPEQATLRHASHVSCSRRALLAGTCHNHMRRITGHLATNRPYFKTNTIQLRYEKFT
jgi:hypothetical protein